MLFSMTFSLLGGLAVQTAHPAPREISDLFEIVALPLVDSFNVAYVLTLFTARPSSDTQCVASWVPVSHSVKASSTPA